jgi:hypothetical protein
MRVQEMERLMKSKVEKENVIERFLEQRFVAGPTTSVEKDAENPEDSGSDDRDDPPLNMDRAKHFMISGSAYQNLRDGIRRFVFPRENENIP